MYNQEQINKVLLLIEEMAKKECLFEEVDNINEYIQEKHQGNTLDAFWDGNGYGITEFAKELKAVLEGK